VALGPPGAAAVSRPGGHPGLGPGAAERVCNGLWDYRPDFTGETWRKGADTVANVRVKDGALVAEAGKTGVLVWKMRSPYVFVGGSSRSKAPGHRSPSPGTAARAEGRRGPRCLFPPKGPARYEYRLRCELPEGAPARPPRHRQRPPDGRLWPCRGWLSERTPSRTRTSQVGPGGTHHPRMGRAIAFPSTAAPPAPVFPAEGGRTDGTVVVFQWRPPQDPPGDRSADYHFELSERADMAWPLSSNFSKLVSNTADRGQPRYRGALLRPPRARPGVPLAGTGQERARVWGPWSKTWRFTPGGPAQPVEMALEPVKGDSGKRILRWKPNPLGSKPIRYRVYGSDEKGFSVSDEPYRRNVGRSKDVPAQAPANFVAETSNTELIVLGAGWNLPNATGPSIGWWPSMARQAEWAFRLRRCAPSLPLQQAPGPGPGRQGVSVSGFGRPVAGGPAPAHRGGQGSGELLGRREAPVQLVKGPAWLGIDKSNGMLRGVPDTVGNSDVVVKVTLQRSVRRLDEGRLSWGQELVKEVVTEQVGSATQRFRIAVNR